MTEWQPIETAPKDGTRIILGKAAGYVMAWAGSGYWFNREPCPHHPPCKPGTHTGWTDGLDTYATPTHWMPLPPPPETLSQNQSQNSTNSDRRETGLANDAAIPATAPDGAHE